MKTETFHELKKQALTGDGKACLALYQAYNNEPDEKNARAWLDLAIERDEPQALFYEGVHALLDGHIEDGIHYMSIAAAHDSADAMYVLGQYYLDNIRGIQTPDNEKNIDLGVEYLRDAGMHGSLDAQLILAKLYYTGKWVRRNLYSARWWIEKACRQSSRRAERLLEEIERVPYLN